MNSVNNKDLLLINLNEAGASEGLLQAANEFGADHIETFSDYVAAFAQFLTLGGAMFVTGDDMPVLEDLVAKVEADEFIQMPVVAEATPEVMTETEVAEQVEAVEAVEPVTAEEVEVATEEVEATEEESDEAEDAE